jgi:hypothetical protein
VILRGSGGKIGRLLLAWNAATRIEPGRASLANSVRKTGLERADGREIGLLAGKADGSLVEKVGFDAAPRQMFFNTVGRMIEAILYCLLQLGFKEMIEASSR